MTDNMTPADWARFGPKLWRDYRKQTVNLEREIQISGKAFRDGVVAGCAIGAAVTMFLFWCAS